MIGLARAARLRWTWVAAVMFSTGWGGNQFTPLLSVYRERNGYSQLDVDLLLGAYVIGLIPGLLLASACSDHLGRRPVLLSGAMGSVVSSCLLASGVVTGLPGLFAGRIVTGAAVGVAMAVGTTWISELSRAPFDTAVSPRAGARRATVALTLGFAVGPAVAGVLAQWGPDPLVLPFVLQAALAVATFAGLAAFGSETKEADRALRLGDRLRVPAAAHRRFRWVVLPMAPWIFGSAGIAYAIVPQLVSSRVGHWTLMYAVGLTVATLGTGVAVQPIARRLDSVSSARGVAVGMSLMTAGVGVSAVTAVTRSPWLGVVTALLLGAAYGIAVVSGLLEIQRMTSATDAAGLTGVYYALAYAGFLLPALLAALAHWVPDAWSLGVLTAIALGCCAVIWTASTKHLPIRPEAPRLVPSG